MMPSRPMRVRARALAKINLHLAIHERRADGFHALTTIFQSIALHDTLTLDTWDGPFELQCHEPGVPTDHTNLVWRAAEACCEVLGRSSLRGLRVSLDKHVPAQSGLGGGSADAMAMVRALARWWDVTIDAERMTAIGRRLGSDVPFFVSGGTALGTGRGDEIEPLPDLPEHAIVIVRPSFGVGTAEAYRWVAESRSGAHPASVRAQGADPPRTPAAWAGRLASCRNEFEPVVAARFPAIAELTRELRAHGAVLAVLSGSGSAVVGLFTDPAAADAAHRTMSNRPDVRSWRSRTVSAADYRAAVEPDNPG